MPELPPSPPAWRRVLALPRALAGELRWSALLAMRRWSIRVRRPVPASRRWALLRRAWARTDPYGTARLVERIRDRGLYSTPPRPSAGATARYRGVMTASWRGELRLADEDLSDWLIAQLGGSPGSDGVPVELSVRVLDGDA